MKKNRFFLSIAVTMISLASCDVVVETSKVTMPSHNSSSSREDVTSAGHEGSSGEEEAASTMRDGVIYSIDGATLDEKSMSFFMLVEPGTKTVSLSGKVKISDNTSWKLYRGETEIATKVAASVDGSLIDGDNPFYIVTTTGLIERTYELNIYRSFYAKII